MKVSVLLAAFSLQAVFHMGDAFRGFSVGLKGKEAPKDKDVAFELPEDPEQRAAAEAFLKSYMDENKRVTVEDAADAMMDLRFGAPQQLLKDEPALPGQWVPATAANGYERSPCPALNTLANHGYINRNGRGIKAEDLTTALTTHYAVSNRIASTLSNQGSKGTGIINLSDLQEHGFIEHDVSLVHEDVALGNTTVVSRRLVEQFLQYSKETKAGFRGVTYDDLIKFRLARAEDSKAKNSALTFNMKEHFVASAEASLLYLVMSRQGVIPEQAISQWLGEEKLPEGFAPRQEEISLFELLTTAAGINWRT